MDQQTFFPLLGRCLHPFLREVALIVGATIATSILRLLLAIRGATKSIVTDILLRNISNREQILAHQIFFATLRLLSANLSRSPTAFAGDHRRHQTSYNWRFANDLRHLHQPNLWRSSPPTPSGATHTCALLLQTTSTPTATSARGLQPWRAPLIYEL